MNGQMPGLPDGRAGQLLAVCMGLLVLAAIWFGAIAPVLGWYEGRTDELRTARLELAHMEALQKTLPALRVAMTQNAAQSAGTAVLLTGDSDAIAGANLQAALSDLATQAGTSLDSAETVPAQPAGALLQIGVAVSVSTTWPKLVAYLTAIDAAAPRMVVDDLSVSSNAAPQPLQDVMLEASFTVSAFRAGGGS